MKPLSETTMESFINITKLNIEMIGSFLFISISAGLLIMTLFFLFTSRNNSLNVGGSHVEELNSLSKAKMAHFINMMKLNIEMIGSFLFISFRAGLLIIHVSFLFMTTNNSLTG